MRIGNSLPEYSPIRRRRGATPDDEPQSGSLVSLQEADEPETLQRSPASARKRVAQRRAARKRQPVIRILLVALVLVFAAGLGLPYALHFFYHDQPLPGITVQGMPTNGLPQPELTTTLQMRYDAFLSQPVTLVYGERVWTPTLGDLGVTFDLATTSDAAVAAARSGDPITRWQQLWTLWQQGLDIAPHITIDRTQMQQYLLGIAAELNQAPRDARLNIARDSVISVAAIDGLQVLVDATANDLILSLVSLEPQEVVLRTRLLDPIVPDSAALAAEEQLRNLMSTPLVLRHNEQEWVWSREQIVDFVDIKTRSERLVVSFDEEQLTREITELGVQIDSGSVEPRLRFDGTTLSVLAEGQSGWRLRPDEAYNKIIETLEQSATTTRTLTLPVDELSPVVDVANLDALGIREVVGEGLSSFAGSAPYRITNIKAGAARMEGVLIAPDEEFSFNTQLGEVNADNGFVEGYAVVNNRTTLEWGGGVCQDSTTLFRAAFWAGLPITERHAHPFYISWYDAYGLGPYGNGAGLDAAIYTGQDDLRFINDTGSWLLLQTTVDEVNQVLTMRLYGTRPEREVTIDGPYITNEISPPTAPQYIDDPTKPVGYLSQTDVARSGRDITIYRVISQNGVEVTREPFHTHFRAWPNIYVRGTGSL